MPGRPITGSDIEGKKTGRHRIQHYIREGRRCRMQKKTIEDGQYWNEQRLDMVFLSSRARALCAGRQEGMTTGSGAMRARRCRQHVPRVLAKFVGPGCCRSTGTAPRLLDS